MKNFRGSKACGIVTKDVCYRNKDQTYIGKSPCTNVITSLDTTPSLSCLQLMISSVDEEIVESYAYDQFLTALLMLLILPFPVHPSQ